MTLFVSAGEASGDAYGAAFVSEVRRLAAENPRAVFIAQMSALSRARSPIHPRFLPEEALSLGVAEVLHVDLEDRVKHEFTGDLEAFWGKVYELSPTKPEIQVLSVGGPKLERVSDKLIANSGHWGAISVTQSFKVGPRVLAGTLKTLPSLRHEGFGAKLAVPIDFGFVNSRLARIAKRNGWKILSFIPPGSWRRNRQAKWGPELYDGVSTPFSWSADLLTKMGTPNVHWFGHPLKQLLRDRIAEASQTPRLDQIAVLPGSRKHELQMNLPLVAASIPDLPAEFALSPQVDLMQFKARWQKLAPHRNDTITVGDSAGVLLRSRAALVCSGTATLEAAICRCPMAVIYAVSRLMYAEAKLLRIKRPTYVALPNILLDRMCVAEFIAHDAFPEKVRPCIHELLEDGGIRQAQLDGFEELNGLLGGDDAITRTAALALEMLGVSTSRP